MSVQVALREGDAEVAQDVGGGLVLDSFGDRVLAEVSGEGHDRADDEHVALAAGQVTDEVDVDLEVLGRKSLEVGEAGEAGSEVVQSEAAAELDQPLGERASPRSMFCITAVSVISKTRLLGIGPVLAQLALDQVEHPRVSGGGRGQVDADRPVRRRRF